jgi:hypothetical protein
MNTNTNTTIKNNSGSFTKNEIESIKKLQQKCSSKYKPVYSSDEFIVKCSKQKLAGQKRWRSNNRNKVYNLRKSYYSRGFQGNNNKKWDSKWDNIILSRSITDYDLSYLIQRSKASIQNRRLVLTRRAGFSLGFIRRFLSITGNLKYCVRPNTLPKIGSNTKLFEIFIVSFLNKHPEFMEKYCNMVCSKINSSTQESAIQEYIGIPLEKKLECFYLSIKDHI